MSCNLLYVPTSPEPSKFPPIIVELQCVVDKDFIERAIRYCLNVYSSFKIFPVMLIICIEKLSPTSYNNNFKVHNEKPFMSKMNCEHWAKDCFLMSSDTILSFVENEKTDLDPLVALGHFFISQQRRLINVERWRDPTVQAMYKYARDIVEGITMEKEITIAALQTICGTNSDQYSKIRAQLQQVPPNITKALKYVEDGVEYCSRLKRKYDNMAEADDECPPSPMKESTELLSISHKLNGSSSSNSNALLVEFVDKFKAENPGRMQWQICWEEGVKAGRIVSYGCGNSLKRMYYKFRKTEHSAK